MPVKNIGLALSGGGYRASVYHLGVLARLAEDNLLEEVTAISSVSGGSLATALIMSLNGLQWPTSVQYLDDIVILARKRLMTVNLEAEIIKRLILAIFTLKWTTLLTRAADLSQVLRLRWGLTAPLSKLPDRPRWFINAACYESGKNWRFDKDRVGDYLFGYNYQTDTIPVSDAVAASCGFPGLIGALAFDRDGRQWSGQDKNSPAAPDKSCASSQPRLTIDKIHTVHLWDGGAYDNNGLEVFHDFEQPRWQQGVDFLIVSDASEKSYLETYHVGLRALLHMITGVMLAQIRSLRARAVVALMSQTNTQAKGAYLEIGNTCQYVFAQAQKTTGRTPPPNIDGLSAGLAVCAAGLNLEIRPVTQDEFKLLFRHGFEVADSTLTAYHPDLFQYKGYGNTRWPTLVG